MIVIHCRSQQYIALYFETVFQVLISSLSWYYLTIAVLDGESTAPTRIILVDTTPSRHFD